MSADEVTPTEDELVLFAASNYRSTSTQSAERAIDRIKANARVAALREAADIASRFIRVKYDFAHTTWLEITELADREAKEAGL